MGTILVTGGTGTVGRRVAALLRSGQADVRTASRNTTDGGHPHVRFDWEDPTTFPTAVEGIEQAFVVAPLSEPAPAVARFLDVAVGAGLRRVVLLSSSAVTDSPSGLGALPPAVRKRVAEVAVLRPSWFMENFVGSHPIAAGIRERGHITSATGRGRVAFIDPSDIATVAAALLQGRPIPDGQLILTGPEALSYDEAASIISEVTGREVRHESITTDKLSEAIAASGLPIEYARVLAGMDEAIAGGSEDRTTTTVRDITGRAPRNFRDFLTAATAPQPSDQDQAGL